MFDESWRYMRDFFYDPDMHGNDWDAVSVATRRSCPGCGTGPT